MVFNWLHIALVIFLVAAIIFAATPIIISKIISPRAKGGGHNKPYECGINPHGTSWIRFGVNYYVYALIFLAFDVDVLYLFPVATYFKSSQGILPIVAILVFISVLLFAVAYFWRRGIFKWPRNIKNCP